MKQTQSQNVAVLGASSKSDRISNQAVKMLRDYGHRVFPIHPSGGEIEELKVYKQLSELPEPIDSLSLYLNAENLKKLHDEILKLKPKRVIFNPGTESPELQKLLNEAGIPFLEACTLVLLRTKQF